MNKSVGISITICFGLVLWMASGVVLRDNAGEVEDSDAALQSSQVLDSRVLVEVTDMQAEEVTSFIITNGSATPDREVLLRAETVGQIDQILVEEGSFVDEGSVIMQIKMDDRAIRQEQASINLQEKQRLYEAFHKLIFMSVVLYPVLSWTMHLRNLSWQKLSLSESNLKLKRLLSERLSVGT